MKKALVIGCGLSGTVIARELADAGYNVRILEKREHIGGNMYDYVDEYGIQVHKYGPHTFHTNKKELFDYISKYSDWDEYILTCGAEIDEVVTPTPFNFSTIDSFYGEEEANELKNAIKNRFKGKSSATVVDTLNCSDMRISKYAQFLFDKDYSLYSAKQWGCRPSEIDISILERVPLRFDYREGYFDDKYQVMPKYGYTYFFENILNHSNISVELNVNALNYLKIKDDKMYYYEEIVDYPIIYTGPLDALFEYRYGDLPYRSIKFELKHEEKDSFQKYPVVAYPQDEKIVRIIEYKKLPIQDIRGTTYEIEYSLPYKKGQRNEPYYPVLTDESKYIYKKYEEETKKIDYLFVSGRLAEFKYYNMDQALEAALLVAKKIISKY